MANQPRLKCRWCSYTVQLFWRQKNGALGRGSKALWDHVHDNHPTEFREAEQRLLQEFADNPADDYLWELYQEGSDTSTISERPDPGLPPPPTPPLPGTVRARLREKRLQEERADVKIVSQGAGGGQTEISGSGPRANDPLTDRLQAGSRMAP